MRHIIYKNNNIKKHTNRNQQHRETLYTKPNANNRQINLITYYKKIKSSTLSPPIIYKKKLQKINVVYEFTCPRGKYHSYNSSNNTNIGYKVTTLSCQLT